MYTHELKSVKSYGFLLFWQHNLIIQYHSPIMVGPGWSKPGRKHQCQSTSQKSDNASNTEPSGNHGVSSSYCSIGHPQDCEIQNSIHLDRGRWPVAVEIEVKFLFQANWLRERQKHQLQTTGIRKNIPPKKVGK